MTNPEHDDATQPPPPPSGVFRRLPKVLDGRFEVRAFLAEGGMSIVHEGRDRALGCPVVIKFLHPSLYADADAVARFEREPRVLAQLAGVSDGFVRPLGAGNHHGCRYLVTERLEGETFQRMLDRGPMSLSDVAWLVREVARSLAASHRLGILHRDIKPENLFSVRRDGARRLKILDLGIAKQTDPGDCHVRTAGVGTPLYMAPESLSHQPISRRVDVWALAAVAYHALTGRPPFPAGSIFHTIQIVCWSDARPLPVTTLVDGLPPALDGWFAKALARDPEARFPTMETMATAFLAAFADAPP